MSYFEELDAWISAVVFGGPEDDEEEEVWFERVRKELKEKILQSYRNGQKAGLNPAKTVVDERPPEAPKRKFWQRRSKNAERQ